MDSDSESLDDVLRTNEHEIAIDERKHNKLLDAISSLDGNKRHKLTQRTVFSNQISEFNFSTSKDSLSKVKLHELVGTLKESGSHGTLKKQLSSVNRKRQVVDVPLPKHEKEKIDRTTAYEGTTVDLSKWDPVVRSNRQADQLEFPLQKSNVKLLSSEQFVKRFQPRTPLELQVAALLQGSDNVIHDKHQELTPAEQRALRAMDLQEARERRNELCRHRALLSYKEAKAKRQKKIKSKKYHRILKKEKLKRESKELEDMKSRDPDGYMEKMKELERARIQERLTLKHRGGSKFARRQMMYAKYNDKARDQVQEMLQMSREITRKTQVESDVEDKMSEDDAHLGDDSGLTSRTTSASDYSYKGDNPWMARPQPVQFTSPDLTAAKSDEEESDNDNKEGDNSESINLLKKSVTGTETDDKVKETSEVQNDIDDIFNQMGKSRKKKGKIDSAKKKKRKIEKFTDEKTGLKDEKMMKDESSQEADVSDGEDEGFISEELVRKRTIEDMDEMLESTEKDESSPAKKAKRNEKKKRKSKADKSGQKTQQKQTEPSVDPKKLLTLETRLQQIGSGPEIIGEDENDDDIDAEEQQRMTIAQAFADDDVIDEFAAEKKDIEDKDKPKDIDLFLPGWGSWGGTGLAPPKRKRKRFTIKAKPAAPRRDVGLGNVIINENKSEAVRKHQVSDIPYPFVNASQFEQSIRAPVGQTWNPETAFQELVKPKIVTQMGAVIAPIDKAEVFKNQKAKNTAQSSQTDKSDKDRNVKGTQKKFDKKSMSSKQKQKGKTGKKGKPGKKK